MTTAIPPSVYMLGDTEVNVAHARFHRADVVLRADHRDSENDAKVEAISGVEIGDEGSRDEKDASHVVGGPALQIAVKPKTGARYSCY